MSNKIKRLTPLRAIRKKCLDCCGGQRSEIKNCNIPDCPLFEFRFGKNPRRKGIGGKKAIVLEESVS